MKLTKLFICILFLNLFSVSLFAQDACPKVSLSAPSGIVKAGEPMVFTAMVSSNDEKLIRAYNWAVSAGTIIEGQETPSIKVDTSGLHGMSVIATLTLSFNGFDLCEKTFSETGVVEEIPKARMIAQLKNNNCEERQAMMDVFFVELNNEPSAMGYIFSFGSPRAVARVEKQMRANLKWRKYDESRITFVNGGGRSKKPTVEFWIVPAGAEAPKPVLPDENEADFDTGENNTKAEIDPKKPFVHSREYYDGGSCVGEDPEIDLEGYAEYLKANPKARGNIVILMMTKAEFRQREKEILDFLKFKGIARKRLRTFHQKTFGGVELWILP